MTRHIATILADNHAEEKADSLLHNPDEVHNFFNTHKGCELKVTDECPDANKNSLYYINAYLAN